MPRVLRGATQRPIPRRRSSPFSGFTLIEMIVVIAIIGALAMVVGPNVFRNVDDARVTAARSQIELMSVALDAFRLDVGRYPTTDEGLETLRRVDSDVTGWRGPYVRREIPLDPWGRPYVYVAPGRANPGSFDLYSLGNDGASGGEGKDADVTSWGGPLDR